MRWVLKGLVFISSYIPVFIMSFLINLSSFKLKDLEKTWESNTYLWMVLIVIGILSLIVLILWLYLMKKESEDRTQPRYALKDIKKYDTEILIWLLTSIIFILTLRPTVIPSIAMNMLLIIITGIYFISNNVLYFNILLIIMGYHIYSAEDETKFIITRKDKESLNFLRCTQIGTSNIFYV